MKVNLDREGITKIIPHRPPFMFLDCGEVDRDQRQAQMSFFVDPKLELFRGHFPDRPVFPAVLQTEALAQCCAVALSQNGESANEEVTPLLVKSDLSFLSLVLPGDSLDLFASFERDLGRFTLMKVRAVKQGGQLCARGTITLTLDQN